MNLCSKFLVGVVVGAGGGCVIALTSVTADAQTSNSDLPVSKRVAQSQMQSRPSSTVLVARMSLRITELESEIRRLTGQNEELTHRLGELEELLNKTVGDTALRLKALESGASPAGSSAVPTGAATSSGANAAPVRLGSTAVSGADKGAQVLGTLRRGSSDGKTKVARVARPPSVVKAETPEQQYDRAHSLIVKQRKYGEAERVLRRFIDNNPKHALASNAHYWLGRTFFVRADYENAAFAFAEGFQKFPEAKKAPANLLNLGMSLARLGKNREACTTYTRLLRTYKDAEASIKRRITRERRRAKCRSR